VSRIINAYQDTSLARARGIKRGSGDKSVKSEGIKLLGNGKWSFDQSRPEDIHSSEPGVDASSYKHASYDNLSSHIEIPSSSDTVLHTGSGPE
jgi:hypothetical protein